MFYPEGSLSDGAAEVATRGFFDADNTPPWDTWVDLFRTTDMIARGFGHLYLVSWVPDGLVPLVTEGIELNPEECLVWLSDTSLPLATRLRSRGAPGHW